METECAGLDHDADTPLDSEMLDWADHIFVMEKVHKQRLSKRFGQFLAGKRIVVLNIRDDYDYMEPALVQLLKERVPRSLRG